MKKIVFIIFLIFQSNGHAYECNAIVRGKRHKLVKRKVNLEDLRSRSSFDGRWFKVVEGMSDSAISFDSDLSLRACNVYHHLTVARNYFKNHFEEKPLWRLRKITVRLNITRGFSDTDHYMHETVAELYNNAISIPRSGSAKMSDVKPWNYEIWFAPAKKIKRQSTVNRALNQVTEWQVRSAMLTGVIQGTLGNYIQQKFAGVQFSPIEQQMYLNSLLVSIGAVVIVPEIAKFTTKILKKKVLLDTAMIPEVIYHEFAHMALADRLSLTHASVANESYANFFAADISNTDTILKKTGRYSKGLVKMSARDPLRFEYWMDNKKYAQFHFGFKLLYEVKKEIGEELARKLIYKSTEKLSVSSNIKDDMTRALVETAKENFPKESSILIFALHDIYQKLGL